MFRDFFRNFIYPTATLVGSIIGVGFLALPYITIKVGIWPMLFYFVLLTILMVVIHVIFAKISLKTPDYKRFPGFVGYYLGPVPKKLLLISESIGLVGVLSVYLIVGGQFLTTIFAPYVGGSALVYTLIYFALVSIFIYGGAKAISRIDFLAISALLAIVLIILIKGFSNVKLGNIFTPQPFFSDFKTMFLPYGALIFSLWGAGLIPEVEEMVKKNKKSLKSIVIVGTIIPAVFYLLFVLVIVGIMGSNTSPSALAGLEKVLPASIVSIAFLIGAITTFIAFIAQGLLLKKVLMYDAKVPQFIAFLLVCFCPLVLFFLGLSSFTMISFIGGFLLGLDGILIMLIYRKIGGKKIVIYPLILIFLLGMAYEIIFFVK